MSVAVMAIVAAMKSVMQPVGDDQQHFGSKDRKESPHQIHARGHHRGRMDQSADRRRAFHGVGQPDVQRELRTLADAAAKNAQPAITSSQ